MEHLCVSSVVLALSEIPHLPLLCFLISNRRPRRSQKLSLFFLFFLFPLTWPARRQWNNSSRAHFSCLCLPGPPPPTSSTRPGRTHRQIALHQAPHSPRPAAPAKEFLFLLLPGMSPRSSPPLPLQWISRPPLLAGGHLRPCPPLGARQRDPYRPRAAPWAQGRCSRCSWS